MLGPLIPLGRICDSQTNVQGRPESKCIHEWLTFPFNARSRVDWDIPVCAQNVPFVINTPLPCW